MNKGLKKKMIIMIGAFLSGSFSLVYFAAPSLTSVEYSNINKSENTKQDVKVKDTEEEKEPEFIVTHVNTPDAVKGIYMTACVAGTPSFRKKLVQLVEETELNSLIIDIKDYTGTISFKTENPVLKDLNGGGCRVLDMKEFIGELHDLGIYVIGRITVFQDPYYSKKYPNLAVKKDSDKNIIWKDGKGISYIDAGAKDFWKYIAELSKESYEIGFDEINYDYIRFPSDGDMVDIYYPFSEERITANPNFGKAEVVQDFAKYINNEMSGTGAVLSADLFGMSMTNYDDLNIGQVLEYLAPYFDYIAPMVYPSHYPRGFMGYQNVNKYPYEIVKFSMDKGVERLIAASSTPSKLRPWLQDNDYPVPYTPEMVRTQIQATYDAGLSSWMLWDAANTYTKEALDKI